MATRTATNPILLRRNMHVGFLDAEADQDFLEHCFVDTGQFADLRDTSCPRCIVVGRTGTGKTALLKQLCRTQENICEIPPETLSLHYISNSNIITFVESLGVKLDTFYTLLWRHVLTCELLRLKYHMYSEDSKNVFFERLRGVFVKDQAKERALKYLEEWGAHFWENTEYRVKEFNQKLETELQTTGSVSFNPLTAGADAARRLTEEQRTEVVARAKEVVNRVQIRELQNVIEVLKEDVFTNAQQKYFIVIDRLDEDWVESSVRYRLIKALIEAVRSFRPIAGMKIIFALRTDLLQRVLSETRTTGFQEEKYESLYLHVRWSPNDLKNLIDRRVNYMFKRQYTKKSVELDDILPKNQIEHGTAMDYIMKRSFLRPRDLIRFFNECISQADGKSHIKIQDIKSAEITYSRERLRSLYDEWRSDFPLLSVCMRILRGRPSRLVCSIFDDQEIEELVCTILSASDSDYQRDPIFGAAMNYSSGEALDSVRSALVKVFYQVGLLGIKPTVDHRWQWSYLDDPTIGEDGVNADLPLKIHKIFWRALGVPER